MPVKPHDEAIGNQAEKQNIINTVRSGINISYIEFAGDHIPDNQVGETTLIYEYE